MGWRREIRVAIKGIFNATGITITKLALLSMQMILPWSFHFKRYQKLILVYRLIVNMVKENCYDFDNVITIFCQFSMASFVLLLLWRILLACNTSLNRFTNWYTLATFIGHTSTLSKAHFSLIYFPDAVNKWAFAYTCAHQWVCYSFDHSFFFFFSLFFTDERIQFRAALTFATMKIRST